MKHLNVIHFLFFFVFIGFHVKGQSDSTTLDLGITRTDKNNIQHIVIKGEDLERMPFTSLSDAIQAYFYGGYTVEKELVYVIDGNFSGNINSYSIHDIESITLIQNAQALLVGTEDTKQLILVKTKSTYTRKSGVTVSAALFIDERRKPGEKSWYTEKSPTLFHQYHITARKYFGHTEIGGTISFIREALPAAAPDKIMGADPSRLNRYLGNFWLINQIGNSSVLTVRFNTSIQDTKNWGRHNYGFSEMSWGSKIKNNIIYPSIRFQTKISNAWSNDFNIAYMHYNITGNDSSSFINGISQLPDYTEFADSAQKKDEFLIRDNISFRKKVGGFVFNPSLSFLYRERKNFDENLLSVYGVSGFRQESAYRSYQKSIEKWITPSISIFNNKVAIEGGIKFNLSKRRNAFNGNLTKRLLPYVSAMADILKLVNSNTSSSLKLYGSHYTNRSDIQELQSQLTDLGISYSIFKDLLSVSYTRQDNRYYYSTYFYISNWDIPIFQKIHIKAMSNIFSVKLKSPVKEGFQYITALTAYGVKSSVEWADHNYSAVLRPEIYQSQFPRMGWSGGWTNQLSWNRVTAGVNILYFFNEQIVTTTRMGPEYMAEKANSLVLQNVYLSYKMKSGNRNAEVYVSSRNLFQNKKSTLESGFNAYYGLGIKADL